MLRTESLRMLLGIGLVLLASGCAPTASTPTPVPSVSPPQPPTSTAIFIQNTPAAVVKLVISQPPSGDSGGVVNLAFSPDGMTLISQTDHGAIILWDAITGQLIDPLTGQGYFAEGLALSPDGKMLASGSCGKHDSGVPGCDRYEIILWNMVTRQSIGQPLELHFAGPTTPVVLFSPDGKILAAMQSGTTGSGIIQLFDVTTRQPITSPLGDQEQFSSMAFSPNGRRMALGNVIGIIYLWDPETRHILSHLVGQRGFVRSVAFSPDGGTLASAFSGLVDVPYIQLWDIDTGQPIGQPLTVQPVTNLAFSPDGDTLASLYENGTITLWDVTTGRQIGQSFTGQSAVDKVGVTTGITFSPDGTLASGNKDGTITLWDMTTGSHSP